MKGLSTEIPANCRSTDRRRYPVGLRLPIHLWSELVIDVFIGQRVSAEDELEGLDIPEMGALAIPSSSSNWIRHTRARLKPRNQKRLAGRAGDRVTTGALFLNGESTDIPWFGNVRPTCIPSRGIRVPSGGRRTVAGRRCGVALATLSAASNSRRTSGRPTFFWAWPCPEQQYLSCIDHLELATCFTG